MSKSDSDNDDEYEDEDAWQAAVQASPPLQSDPAFEKQMKDKEEKHLDATPKQSLRSRAIAEAASRPTLSARAQQLVDAAGGASLRGREYVSFAIPEEWQRVGVHDVYVHLFGAKARHGSGTRIRFGSSSPGWRLEFQDSETTQPQFMLRSPQQIIVAHFAPGSAEQNIERMAAAIVDNVPPGGGGDGSGELRVLATRVRREDQQGNAEARAILHAMLMFLEDEVGRAQNTKPYGGGGKRKTHKRKRRGRKRKTRRRKGGRKRKTRRRKGRRKRKRRTRKRRRR